MEAIITQKNGKRPKFAKGNPGRPKGAKNHFTSIREDFFKVWNKIDGPERLIEYINRSPQNFIRFAELVVKLLPTKIEGEGLTPTIQIIRFERPNADSSTAIPGQSEQVDVIRFRESGKI